MVMSVLVLLGLLLSEVSHATQSLENWLACESDNKNCTLYRSGQDLFSNLGWKQKTATLSVSFQIEDPCFIEKQCWLFLGEIADTARIELNGKTLANYLGQSLSADSYVKNQSILLPIPSESGPHFTLKVSIHDLDGSLFGLRSKKILIGSYQDLFLFPVTDFIKRTGASLLSAFTLFLLGIGLILGCQTTRDVRLVPLAFYSLVTAVYHLSFAELGRQLLLPTLAAGPLHFSLRLAQDYALLLTLLFYFEKKGGFAWLAAIFYGTAVSTLWSLWFMGFHDLQIYLKAMYCLAPLVAAPMFLGAFLFSRSLLPFERTWILPPFLVLVALQINDLLVFWQVYRGVFFIRWYPAFVVMLLMIGLVRRSWDKMQELQREASMSLIAARLSHDIRGPLGAIRFASKFIESQNAELFEILRTAVGRLESLSSEVLKDYKTTQQGRSEITLHDWVSETFKQVEAARGNQYKVNAVRLNITGPSLTVRLNPNSRTELDRVFHNLMCNAFESASTGKDPAGGAEITVRVTPQRKGYFALKITNSGPPIDRALADQLNQGRKGVTFGKAHGNGLGFWSARETVIFLGGKVFIYPEPSHGTTVELNLPLTL
jgi:signal transduction histidine kinase